MALYEWSEEYSVGIGTMDSHHQKLFDIINKMHDAMKAGDGEDVIAAAINELIDYTKYHFSEEEKIMESINYSGIAGQKAAHKAFIDELLKYKDDIDNGMAIFAVSEISTTAVKWLTDHILVMDKQYEDDMKAAGYGH